MIKIPEPTNGLGGEMECSDTDELRAVGLIIGMVVMFWLLIHHLCVAIPLGLLIVGIIKRGFIMSSIEKIKDILGSDDKTTGMKLDAIAKHLKVKLVHVPEHYACKEIKSEQPIEKLDTRVHDAK